MTSKLRSPLYAGPLHCRGRSPGRSVLGLVLGLGTLLLALGPAKLHDFPPSPSGSAAVAIRVAGSLAGTNARVHRVPRGQLQADLRTLVYMVRYVLEAEPPATREPVRAPA